MIVDLCAHAGPWPHRPIGLDEEQLARLLEPWGISRIYAGRLEALWFENPHDANRLDENGQAGRQKRGASAAVSSVPVLDPTVTTWPEELDRLASQDRLAIVRLYPSYGSYRLNEADRFLDALARRQAIAQIIVRMEDPRRQHPLAQVPDVPVASIVEAATRHPELRILLSGAGTQDLRTHASHLPAKQNLWADTSQADGNGAVAGLIKTSWRDRLVFGSHAPLFIAYSALARVLLDLDDGDFERIVRTNAERLLARPQ